MIASMDRVEIVFLRTELAQLVEVLQREGVLHVEEVPLALEQFPGYLHRVHLPEEERAELQQLEALHTLLKEALPLLSEQPGAIAVGEAGKQLEHAGRGQWQAQAQTWHDEIRAFSRRKLDLQDTIELLENYRRILENVLPNLRGRNVRLGETARIVVLQGQNQQTVDALEQRYRAEVGREAEFLRNPLGKNDTVVVVTHPAGQKDAVAAWLRKENIEPVEAPAQDLQPTDGDDVLRKVTERVSINRAELEQVGEQIRQFTERHGAHMAAVDRLVSNRIAQLHVVDNFAQSEMVGVVHGWVPSDQYETLSSTLLSTFGARAAMAHLAHGEVEHKEIPTLLKNPPFFKPFELLLKIFAPPTYGTIDPTIMVAVAFILFYGFILGDVGYGLVILGVATWAKKKWAHVEMVRDGMTVATWMGISGIVFGVLFGEFFGDLPQRYFDIPAPLHRMHQPMVLLGIGILVGAIHVPLALILGVREGYRHGHKHHAEEKLGMLLGLVGLVLVLAAITGYSPVGSTLAVVLGLAAFIACAILLVRSMGAMFAIGLVELIGLSANVLSYARLMALGLASVALADLANMALGNSGIALVLFGIPMAIFVHLLNIGLGVFSPTIHSLRLNYVEFLPKFYEPEGISYEPFRKELAW